jgi:hypothetical protein
MLIKDFHIDLLQSQEKNYSSCMEENKRNKDYILNYLEKEIKEQWPTIYIKNLKDIILNQLKTQIDF